MSTRETLVAGLMGLALAACAPTRPAPVAAAPEPVIDPIRPGIYEASDPSRPKLRLSLFLSPGQGFILRKAEGKAVLAEYRGTWSADADSLRLQVRDLRRPYEFLPEHRASRLDSLIACPIQRGVSEVVPLLRLESARSGPRLVQLGKPPPFSEGWEGDLSLEAAPKKNGKKAGRTASGPKQGRNTQATPAKPPQPAAAKTAATVPES